MSDWQVGDLALCVRDTGHGPTCPFCGDTSEVRKGGIYTVAVVGVDAYGQYLEFDGLDQGELKTESCIHLGYDPARFIKVTPPQADEFDRETIALLNAQPALAPAQPTDRQRSFEQGV